MAKTRVIDCNKCGTEDIPEVTSPLKLSFRDKQEVVVFGLKYFRCTTCSTFYSTHKNGLTKISEKAREAAVSGSNTIVL